MSEDNQERRKRLVTLLGEMLAGASPYGLIQEVDGLIGTVCMVNTALVTECRRQAVERIEGYIFRFDRPRRGLPFSIL